MEKLRSIKQIMQQLKQDYKDGRELNLIGFWGNHNDTPEEQTFSNFQRTYFTYDINTDLNIRSVNEVRFSSSEQFFMYKKAVHFRDLESVRKITEPGHEPSYYKLLGRKVTDYDDSEWAKVRYQYMLEALRLKYGNNQDLLDILLNTGDAILVEASPFDKVWGIGLAKHDKLGNVRHDWKNPLKWRGDNLLGFALMQVREEFRNQE